MKDNLVLIGYIISAICALSVPVEGILCIWEFVSVNLFLKLFFTSIIAGAVCLLVSNVINDDL